MPAANIDLVKQFLKLKPPTFNDGMNPIKTNDGMNPVKTNEWLSEMEKNFWMLKLKPPTFNSGMNMVKANERLLEMEKNFWLLRCDEVQKVKIGLYLLTREADRWWNLKGVRESGMNWTQFKVIFKE